MGSGRWRRPGRWKDRDASPRATRPVRPYQGQLAQDAYLEQPRRAAGADYNAERRSRWWDGRIASALPATTSARGLGAHPPAWRTAATTAPGRSTRKRWPSLERWHTRARHLDGVVLGCHPIAGAMTDEEVGHDAHRSTVPRGRQSRCSSAAHAATSQDGTMARLLDRAGWGGECSALNPHPLAAQLRMPAGTP